MLTTLTIKNYALIDNLQVDFGSGLTTITGETGAGKSIMLGALGLIQGKRADLHSLKNTAEKCIIEAVFNVESYNLKSVFEENDLDYEAQTIIRREILPSGKSRAFVNDTPVVLDNLRALSGQLIDIHSQHQTLQLTDEGFQFKLIDALAETSEHLRQYSEHLQSYKTLQKEHQQLVFQKNEAVKEHDYNSFLLEELETAQLKDGEQQALEEEYETLNNVEEIGEKLSHSVGLLSDEQAGILYQLTELKNNVQKLTGFSAKYQNLSERINSSLIELDDVFSELETLIENVENNPGRLEEVNAKLSVLDNLMRKHTATSETELIAIRESLKEKVAVSENIDGLISEKETQLKQLEVKLDKTAETIHNKRQGILPKLQELLITLLANLGMPNAQFKMEVALNDTYFSNGKDTLTFLFTANKGGQFNELKKAASGGELSRIMLAIKAILTQHINLPTVIFDEIDTGVSGEISNKMADIMKQMSHTLQVLTITHLPQIAAKGDAHFKVYKEDKNNQTHTNIVKLDSDARVVEIAQMLGGNDIADSAVAHAKQLLN